MKTLYSEDHVNEAIERLQKISGDQKPIWGKMNAGQMMSHCSLAMEVARGEKKINRIFISYILGPIFKKGFYNDTPVPRNSPTHPLFRMTGETELQKERDILIEHLRAFQAGGPEKCTTGKHAFFGTVTKEQWGMGMYKHLDHHLQQFGV